MPLDAAKRPAFRFAILLATCIWVPAVFTVMACAQDTSGRATALYIDLPRYYFKSPQEEIAARADLDAAVERLHRFKTHLNSDSQLLAFLQENDAIQKLFIKHDDYLYLRCSLNRKDSACDEDEKLASGFKAKTAFVDSAILSIPPDRMRLFLSQDSKLKRYSFEVSEIQRDEPHLLPRAQERFLDALRPEVADWQYNLYDRIVGGINFGTVPTAMGPLDVIRQRNLIAGNADARVRQEGFMKRYAGYASQRDLIAFALLHMVDSQTTLAKAHHYADATARKYESLYLNPDETRNLLARMAQNGSIPKRYEKIRSQEIEASYHQPAHVWDMSAPPFGLKPPIVPIAEVRRVFNAVFAGLGKEYQTAFDALLDPANGRADILPGGAADRYGGGFSLGLGGTAVLFYGRYDGTFKDLSVIAHEGGHATHRALMNANRVLPCYQRGPNFLFESFAEFNELLLADYMAEHAETPEGRSYYRERWMNIKGLDAFYGAQDAMLEQGIYDGVSAGTIRNADDLDLLTLKIDDQFSDFPASTPELRNRWAMVALMFEDALYDVNYVYGGLLALKYFQLYSTRKDWFVPRYVGMLKNGFNEPPADLLRRFLGIDLFSLTLLNDDLELLAHRLDQMEATTAEK
jgi:oligoendopeptidase F